MALIVLASAQGSPGVTTTALGLALIWPRPVLLVDADPTGASAVEAGYFQGGHDLPVAGSLVDLVMSQRSGSLARDLPAMATAPFPAAPTVHFLPGADSHTQARSLETLWEPLAGVLKALERNGQDVIVDAGRLGLRGSPEPVLLAADLALLVTRSTLPALIGAKSWADHLRERFDHSAASSNLGALVIGPGQPYSPRNVAETLRTQVVSTVSWDPVSAEVLSRGAKPSRGFQSSSLSSSLRASAAAIQAVLDANRQSLLSGNGRAER